MDSLGLDYVPCTSSPCGRAREKLLFPTLSSHFQSVRLPGDTRPLARQSRLLASLNDCLVLKEMSSFIFLRFAVLHFTRWFRHSWKRLGLILNPENWKLKYIPSSSHGRSRKCVLVFKRGWQTPFSTAFALFFPYIQGLPVKKYIKGGLSNTTVE